MLFRAQAEWEKGYKREVNREFDKQKEEILDKHPTKIFTKKDLTDWTFDVTASKRRLVARLMPFTTELMRSQAQFAFDLTGDEDLELEVTQRMIAYIHDRIDRFSTSANDETIHNIEATITEGIKDGDSLYKLKNRISAVYFEATTIRSERIARTETIAASNEAANEAYRQSPLTVAKEWHIEPGACEFCRALNKKIIGLDEDFVAEGSTLEGADGGHYNVKYETVYHPPAHPNCRCTILPVAG